MQISISSICTTAEEVVGLFKHHFPECDNFMDGDQQVCKVYYPAPDWDMPCLVLQLTIYAKQPPGAGYFVENQTCRLQVYLRGKDGRKIADPEHDVELCGDTNYLTTLRNIGKMDPTMLVFNTVGYDRDNLLGKLGEAKVAHNIMTAKWGRGSCQNKS